MSHISIDVEQLSFAYENGYPAIKNVSFHGKEQDSIGIIGANGAGKSTLLKILIGLNPGFSGSVRILGLPVEKKNLAQIRSRVGYVFQDSDSQLFMTTVFEDVAFAPKNYGLSAPEVKRRAEEALRLVGAGHLKDKKIYQLSGGEKKLAALAAVLAMTPGILLMDEPSAALDPGNRRHLIRLLRSLDCLKVIASHDLDLVLDTCKRTILLGKGELIRDGLTEDILTDRRLLEENGLELPLRFQGRGFD